MKRLFHPPARGRKPALAPAAVLLALLLHAAPAPALTPPPPPPCGPQWRELPIPELARQVLAPFDPQDLYRDRCAFEALSTADPARATPALLEILRSGDEPARILALGTLEMLGEKAAPAAPQLIRRLAEADTVPDGLPEGERAALYRALAALGEAAAPAFPLLVQRLESRNDSAAIQTLGRLGRHAPGIAVPPLLKLLEQPNLVSFVAWALLEIGEPARIALPRLQALANAALDQEDASALSHLGPAIAVLGQSQPQAQEALVQRLIQALDASPLDLRQAALGLLGELGPAAHLATPRVVRLLREDTAEPVDRDTLIRTLIGIDGGSPATLDLLFAEALERNSLPAKLELARRKPLPAAFGPPLRRRLQEGPADFLLGQMLQNVAPE